MYIIHVTLNTIEILAVSNIPYFNYSGKKV